MPDGRPFEEERDSRHRAGDPADRLSGDARERDPGRLRRCPERKGAEAFFTYRLVIMMCEFCRRFLALLPDGPELIDTKAAVKLIEGAEVVDLRNAAPGTCVTCLAEGDGSTRIMRNGPIWVSRRCKLPRNRRRQ